MSAFTLTSPIAAPIRRVLDASRVDAREAVAWLMDPKTETVRKACLLNILAVLNVTPTPEAPLIAHVLTVFVVKVDRIYVTFGTDVLVTLEDYVEDVRMPFYEDPGTPLAIHHELLTNLPFGIAAPGFQAGGVNQTPLTSFRAEGAPSLQIVVAESPYPYTVADIDLDAHNPLQDVVGFAGHMWELVSGKRSGLPTDQLAMRSTLSRGPAAGCLCYTLGG